MFKLFYDCYIKADVVLNTLLPINSCYIFSILPTVCFMHFGDVFSNVFKARYEIHCLLGVFFCLGFISFFP